MLRLTVLLLLWLLLLWLLLLWMMVTAAATRRGATTGMGVRCRCCRSISTMLLLLLLLLLLRRRSMMLLLQMITTNVVPSCNYGIELCGFLGSRGRSLLLG